MRMHGVDRRSLRSLPEGKQEGSTRHMVLGQVMRLGRILSVGLGLLPGEGLHLDSGDE